jgi:hypothetical protein
VFKPALVGKSEGVAAGTPWWQMTKTARRSFVLGTPFAVLGLYWLVAGLTFSAFWMLLPAVWFLVWAILYLASALTLRRRERSGPGADSQGTLTR